MSNSIFNNDDITYSNGVRNPMIKNLACNKYDIQDAGKISCNDMEIDENIIIAGNIELANGNLELTNGNLELQNGNVELTNGNVELTNGDLEVQGGEATINGDCNVGGNLSLTLQGGLPTYNIAGCYGVNNVPSLETFFQSFEAPTQTGVATLRSSNGAVSGQVAQVICNGSTGITMSTSAGTASITAPSGISFSAVGSGIDCNNEVISNVSNPVASQDVATKDYVDSEVENSHEKMNNPQDTLLLGSDGVGDYTGLYNAAQNVALDVETINYRTYRLHMLSGAVGNVVVFQADNTGAALGGSNRFWNGTSYVSSITMTQGQMYEFIPFKQSASPSRLLYCVKQII